MTLPGLVRLLPVLAALGLVAACSSPTDCTTAENANTPACHRATSSVQRPGLQNGDAYNPQTNGSNPNATDPQY